jgi:dolichol-phosphate mannosyltransferase
VPRLPFRGELIDMRVSVVIPALNEAGNIGRLVEETYAAVSAEFLAEVIVVDDCSTDATGAEIKTLLARETLPGLRYLRHSERSGQSAAVRTGVFAATSPVIATMDGDGQNNPHDLPRLIDRLSPPGGSGPALVGGIRTNRQAESSKRVASRAANWIRDRVLRDDCPDTGCGIKVFWREAFLRLPFFSGMHRYLPALFQTYGHGTTYVPVSDRPRVAGVSKYSNLGRALIGIHDLIGVTWLRKRTKVPMIVEDLPEGRQVSDLSSRIGRRGDAGRRASDRT